MTPIEGEPHGDGAQHLRRSEYQFTITNLAFTLEDGEGAKEREIVLTSPREVSR